MGLTMKAFALLVVAAALAVVVLAGERPAGGVEPSVLLRGSTGSLKVGNSHSGHAVVRGLNMAPGQRAVGRVGVSVDRAARMRLRIDRVERFAGLSGRGLGRWLRLKVKRVGPGPGPRRVYRGLMMGRSNLDLGRWEAGAKARYQVKLRLRASSASQNDLQGAGTRFRLRWRASE